MAYTDDISGRTISKFMNAWYKHPLSVSIVILVVDIAFIFMILNNKINSTEGLALARYTYYFSGGILAAILIILFVRKDVLYNVFELLEHDMDHRIHLLQESLSKIQMGIGDREEALEKLCPKTSKNKIDRTLRSNVGTFESLTHLFEDSGIKISIDQKTYLALAKFYYTEGEYEEALNKIIKARGGVIKNMLRNTHIYRSESLMQSELDYCHGLILQKLGRDGKSKIEAADRNGHPTAKCIICKKAEEFVKKDVFNSVEVEKYIESARCCSKSNIAWCMNNLTKMYFSKAKLSLDKKEKSAYVRNALLINNIGISFGSWMAYFNKACNLSFMAQHGIVEEGDVEDGNAEAVPTLSPQRGKAIFECLEKAFLQRPALARFSLTDNDLNWVRENLEDDFNKLIGSTYVKHYQLIG